MIMQAEDFLSLSKKQAQDLAESKYMIFHLVRIDDERFFDYPSEEDKRFDRICVEIDRGKITKAVIQ